MELNKIVQITYALTPPVQTLIPGTPERPSIPGRPGTPDRPGLTGVNSITGTRQAINSFILIGSTRKETPRSGDTFGFSRRHYVSRTATSIRLIPNFSGIASGLQGTWPAGTRFTASRTGRWQGDEEVNIGGTFQTTTFITSRTYTWPSSGSRISVPTLSGHKNPGYFNNNSLPGYQLFRFGFSIPINRPGTEQNLGEIGQTFTRGPRFNIYDWTTIEDQRHNHQRYVVNYTTPIIAGTPPTPGIPGVPAGGDSVVTTPGTFQAVNYWGKKIEEESFEDIDENGIISSNTQSKWLLRFNKILLTDNILFSKLTDEYDREWDIVGADDTLRKNYIELNCQRRVIPIQPPAEDEDENG